MATEPPAAPSTQASKRSFENAAISLIAHAAILAGLLWLGVGAREPELLLRPGRVFVFELGGTGAVSGARSQPAAADGGLKTARPAASGNARKLPEEAPESREAAREAGAGLHPGAEVGESAGADTVVSASAALGGGGPVMQDELVPRYPSGARRRGEQGSVTIEVRVEPDGSVSSARIVSSSGFASLDESAREALARARFRWPFPAHEAVSKRIVVEFRLSDGR